MTVSITAETSFDLTSLRAAYDAGATPLDLVAEVERRVAAWADPALFLSRPTPDALRARAAALSALSPGEKAALPLFGVPFVAKDNIDVAGLPTTAACPDFAFVPTESATVVTLLEAAGAILIGKANLDQFATGLVGVRSPYGVPRNSFDPRIIPGGSSSGSATSVAAGLATFSLGTDTAGSGRVPAGLNNLVGLKPTPGLISTKGVLPACRTLDCVSVFALTVDDAFAVLQVAGTFDAADPYARSIPVGALACPPPNVRVGIPGSKDRRFFGDTEAEKAFADHLSFLEGQGMVLIEVDFEPLFAVARQLYEGPWVAERYAAIEDFIKAKPEALHPVTRAITEPAITRTAVDAFKAQYRVAELARANAGLFAGVDVLAVPTAPRAWTVAEVEGDPIATNSALGTYTNFVNLLGFSALAIPMAFRTDGFPAGITLIGPGGADHRLASLGRVLADRPGRQLGATSVRSPGAAPLGPVAPEGHIEIAVVGAHLSGMALNRELTGQGGVFVKATTTAPDYRFYALPGTPARPGLVRVPHGEGGAIALEVWALPPAGFGAFVAAIPAPLGIGKLRLADGTLVSGFLCEAEAAKGARDITDLGGWRAYLAS